MPPYSEFIVFTDSKGGFEKILLLRNRSLITNSYIDLIMHMPGLGEDSQLEFGYIDSCFNFIGCWINPSHIIRVFSKSMSYLSYLSGSDGAGIKFEKSIDALLCHLWCQDDTIVITETSAQCTNVVHPLHKKCPPTPQPPLKRNPSISPPCSWGL